MHESSLLHMTRFRDKFLNNRQNQALLIADLGSYDVNGSYRPLFERPAWRYFGLDVCAGPNVDIVLKDPYRWSTLASSSIDVVISGQAFEHIEFFWLTALEMSRVLKPDGLCCLIVPSSGFEHRYPVDCWRFYSDGLQALMNYAGLEVLDVYTNHQAEGWQDDSGSWQDSVVVARQPKKSLRRRWQEWLRRRCGRSTATPWKRAPPKKQVRLMSSDYAVSLRGIEKSYKLYQSPLARFKEALHPRKKNYYEDFYALKGLDLDIPHGQTWGIIGLNGSGKSTLLKIICGVLQPSQGSLQINGRIAALLELGSGFNPEYTGRQNVYFSGALADVSRAEMEGRFPEIEAFAEIGDFIDQPVKNYSSGMLMRLAFAVAVHVSPDILVVDEALAVGDARFQHKCMKKIKSFKGHSTMLLVTHDMNAVLTLCDQVIWLHEGNLVEIGKPKKIVDKYTQAFYEGGPPEIPLESESEWTGGLAPASASLPVVEVAASIEVSDTASAFGTGEVKISQVALLSRERGPVDAVYGGEAVAFHLWLESVGEINDPIVGFLAKNKLGIEIFGFNNISLQTELPPLRVGESYLVDFEFTWPQIAADSYAISIAIAEGDQELHTMHHWIHDVITIEVMRTQEYQFGLVGVEEAKMGIKLLDAGISLLNGGGV